MNKDLGRAKNNGKIKEEADGSLDGYKAQISGFQLFQILFLSRMFSLLSYSALTKETMAPFAVLIAIASSFIVDLVIIMPILLLQKKNKGANIIDNASEINRTFGKVIAFIFCILCVFISSLTVSKFEFFLTSSVYIKASHLLIAVMFIIVSVYAVYLGIEALSRFAFVIFAAFIIAFLFIIIANIKNFDIGNMFYGDIIDERQNIANTIVEMSFKNTEYFLLLMCAGEVRGKIRKSIVSWLAASVLIFEIISFTMIAVLGKTADNELFPFYILAGTAEISVFQRLDALHISIWILIAFIKTSIFIFYSNRALKYLIPLKAYKYSLPVIGIIIIIISAILSSNLVYLNNFSSFVFNGYSYCIFIILIPLIIILLKSIKEKSKTKKKRGI